MTSCFLPHWWCCFRLCLASLFVLGDVLTHCVLRAFWLLCLQLTTKGTQGYRHLSCCLSSPLEGRERPHSLQIQPKKGAEASALSTWNAPLWCRPTSKLVFVYRCSQTDLIHPLNWEVGSCSSLGMGYILQDVSSVYGHQYSSLGTNPWDQLPLNILYKSHRTQRNRKHGGREPYSFHITASLRTWPAWSPGSTSACPTASLHAGMMWKIHFSPIVSVQDDNATTSALWLFSLPTMFQWKTILFSLWNVNTTNHRKTYNSCILL